ncbi:MAG TPA: hypothetical protein PKI27_09515, partial [Dermatophilaceae bacterium]|nr:hypothetical protein [Dermatophilaceae bacterium]
ASGAGAGFAATGGSGAGFTAAGSSGAGFAATGGSGAGFVATGGSGAAVAAGGIPAPGPRGSRGEVPAAGRFRGVRLRAEEALTKATLLGRVGRRLPPWPRNDHILIVRM